MKNKTGTQYQIWEDKSIDNEIIGKFGLCKSSIFDKTNLGHKILQKIYFRINDCEIINSDNWDDWDAWDAWNND